MNTGAPGMQFWKPDKFKDGLFIVITDGESQGKVPWDAFTDDIVNKVLNSEKMTVQLAKSLQLGKDNQQKIDDGLAELFNLFKDRTILRIEGDTIKERDALAMAMPAYSIGISVDQVYFKLSTNNLQKFVK